ncbi:MAG: hypothetical protein KDE45_00340 [Caldilineaceae bacterium]|nr:hypothetical protein [Caldilineaceae bacterium]
MTAYPDLRLSDQTAQAIRAADRLVNRDFALQALRDLLDPERQLSTWALAGVIGGHLRRFQGEPYRRIAQGHRAPQGALEAALAHCCAGDCPASQRRVFDLLVDLRL